MSKSIRPGDIFVYEGEDEKYREIWIVDYLVKKVEKRVEFEAYTASPVKGRRNIEIPFDSEEDGVRFV